MSLPRLHPDDLQQISSNIISAISSKFDDILTKQMQVSEMQTLTVKDVSRIINKDPNTILRYIDKKLIKASKIGKEWIITPQSLNLFINGK